MYESESPEHAAHVNYGMYVLIWIALLILTQFTVTAAQLHLGAMGIIIAVIVTPVKALLVLYFFMHLGYERLMFKGMFAFAVSTLIIAIGFTFLDVVFR